MPANSTAPRRGRLFVIAAPSGAGKTSLVRALMEREPSLRFSISYPTRKRSSRPIEGSALQAAFNTLRIDGSR